MPPKSEDRKLQKKSIGLTQKQIDAIDFIVEQTGQDFGEVVRCLLSNMLYKIGAFGQKKDDSC